ncbi:MAG: DNA repair protein RadA [Lachnospiraceae bacterium]|nr:DNA repair protein RadA [Lachnospiraceae bacterium]
MAKKDTSFFCKECGYESGRWLGQCPGCKAWNSFVEAPAASKSKSGSGTARVGFSGNPAGFGGIPAPVNLNSISLESEERISTGMKEFDRVLGDGIVPGSLILVGGDPGIGKSTILLQTCRNLADAGRKVLYISGEESLKQIKLRAMRIGEFKRDLRLLCETSLDRIETVLEQEKPEIAVIDSIQTMYREDIDSAPGSVSQVRESTNLFLKIAKGLGIAVFLVGHVTKEGTVAGPRVLEHMVDTVLYFEGDRYASYRILRSVKNRFGSTNEIGVFEMKENGLAEVANPSEYMLNGRPKGASGSVVSCTVEGTRPILVEIQALVARTNFGMPRRTAAGTDYNRVNLLMAVLEKRLGLSLADYDAYLNVAGGLSVSEPAIDLAIVAALISSRCDFIPGDGLIVFGEVGLSGEIRAVSQPQTRIAEVAKLGFTECILPKVSLDGLRAPGGIRLIGVENVAELFQALK